MINSIQPVLEDLTWIPVAVLLAPFVLAASDATGVPRLRGIAIYGFHLVFVLIYAVFAMENQDDAFSYYQGYGFMPEAIPVGTSAIAWSVWLCREQLLLTYLGTSVVFGAVGSIGVILLNRCLIDRARSGFGYLLVSVLTFLPSAHIWTSGIGKDGAAFTAAALVTWATPAIGRRFVAVMAGLILMTLIRPYVTPLLAIQVLLGALGERRRSWPACAFAVTAIVAGVASSMIASGSEDLAGASARWQQQAQLSNTGESARHIAQQPLPAQFFGYLFFPLTGGPTVTWIASSVDNWLLLCVCGTGLIGWLRRVRCHHRRTVWLPEAWFLISMLIVFAPATSNLGLAARQRTMIYPAVMSLAIAGIGRLALDKSGRRRTVA